MASRPQLLMVSPIVPASSGNGLAMRAAMSLRALAHHYRVSLLVVPRYFSPAGRSLPGVLVRLCDEVVIERPAFGRHLQASANPASERLQGHFDVIHLFRLASKQAARPWLGKSVAVHLDFDDVESVSRPSIAALYRDHGRLAEAESEEQAARIALEDEIEALKQFDRVYVCSEADSDRLPLCGNAQVRILPNAVELPEDAGTSPAGGDPFTFLFVGTLGYFPNEEGLIYFATAVLPLLRQMAPMPFRFQIVGYGHSAGIERLNRIEDIDVIGAVDNVTPRYTGADAVVVPIRAGGGTRIKVLEAFAYRRPVISTSIGLEGIAAQHNVHVLVADDPAEFARACLELMGDETRRAELADRAFQLVRDSYTLDAMIDAVRPDPQAPRLLSRSR